MNRRKHLFILTLCMMLTSFCYADSNDLRLWYDKPADATEKDKPYDRSNDSQWVRSLPLGNGYMGCMVYGDVKQERIQLNHKHLWSGSVQDADNPAAFAARSKIQELLFSGQLEEAEKLAAETQICKGFGTNHAKAATKPYGCYQTLGDLRLDFTNKSEYTNYERSLNLEKAIVAVGYSQEGIDFKRTVFASHPSNVIVVRLESSIPQSISFSATMDRPERFTTIEDNDQLLMYGSMDDGKGGDGMKYWVRADAEIKDGEKCIKDGVLHIKDASEVTLYLTSQTDYVGYPTYLDTDFEETTSAVLKSSIQKPYAELLKEHIEDYSHYFSRVNFEISDKGKEDIPTDVRLSSAKKGNRDVFLESLLFQYGRYLLIASSREGSLPANLQGVWCSKINSAWNGDYHMNINLQMNYWPAQVTNLSEMFIPYVDLMESIQEPGKKTAQIHYGSKGWCVHPVVNVWGFTSPAEVVRWGSHTGAAGWLCLNLWEEYLFTQDKNYLERIYPILQSTALFYSDILVEDPRTGKFISSPATSPENTYYDEKGIVRNISAGSAHDHQVIRVLFLSYLEANKILKTKDPLVPQIKTAMKHLQGDLIGEDGRIIEWDREYKEVEPGHRHMSHLYAFFPANTITEQTPELYTAARKSVDYRIKHVKGPVAWCSAWKISMGARFKDEELTSESISSIIQRITPNLFTSLNRFQIEANLGYTSGVAEVLLQSHQGYIELLPALPKEWKTGKMTGLIARGNIKVDMYWEDNKLIRADIISQGSNIKKQKIRYKNSLQEISLKKGESKSIRF